MMALLYLLIGWGFGLATGSLAAQRRTIEARRRRRERLVDEAVDAAIERLLIQDHDQRPRVMVYPAGRLPWLDPSGPGNN